LLDIIVSARKQELGSADSALAAMAPLTEDEHRRLAEMLSVTPEAIYPAYQRWARSFMKRSDAVVAGRPSAKNGLRPIVVTIAALIAVLALALAALAVLRQKRVSAVDALSSLLDDMSDGNFVGVWDALPPTYRADGDAAFRVIAASIPARALEDMRAIDAGLANVVSERLGYLKGSRVDAIGPYFRTLGGEEGARALANYYADLAKSPIYDAAWLTEASVRDVLVELTAGDFTQCWKIYFRSSGLENELWQEVIGLKDITVGQIVSSKRTFAVASPDDGSGRVVVAILLPKGQRVDVAMRLVDDRWVPEPIHDEWRLLMLQIQSKATRADSALSFAKGLEYAFNPKIADERKLCIIDAMRADNQEKFDAAAKRFFGP
jgi:hypothetical protein